MSTFRRLLVLLALSCALAPAHAALILAQIVDTNPGIRGLTYIDGVLTQDELLGEEVYDGRFTGFVLRDPGLLTGDVEQRINIFDASGTKLIATLAYGGNAETNFVHTSYFSDSTEFELTPVVFPTMSLIADGTFQTVLEFTSDTGDQYIFQYRYVTAAIPEPSSAALFAATMAAFGFVHRRRPRRGQGKRALA